MSRIITDMWFDTEALEAAEHCCSIFPNSEIARVLEVAGVRGTTGLRR